MRQVLQNLKDGSTTVAEVPCGRPGAGEVLIRTSHSLVSAGTERMLVEFGKATLLEKARQQPDKVRQVFEKIRTDGLLPTIEAVRNKLEQPLALGYCNAGVVVEVGARVKGFTPGMRVASNGKHAELVCVPANLCCAIPDDVTDEAAAFTVVAAIGLQGVRIAQPTLGEFVVVTGLGLIGLITVQLLVAQGCQVLGLDFDPAKLELARRFGAQVLDLSSGADPAAAASSWSRGRGVDAVIITASTRSSDPVHQAALMCRKRGRIVLVGVTGLELSRADFYEKELTFQVSCSYGPGRYDPEYESKGNDYPVGFVRWTAQRNFEAVLDMLAGGGLNVVPLISHRVPIEEGERAYTILSGSEPSLGIMLVFPQQPEREPEQRAFKRIIELKPPSAARHGGAVSLIGAGNYATGVLMPAFRKEGARLRTAVASSGSSSLHAARKHGFEQASTDAEQVFADPDTAAVVIATRHDSHAALVLRALAAGKHVLVEKPLCLTLEELKRIEEQYQPMAAEGRSPLLAVGFNRRFSPLVVRMKSLLAATPGPKAMVMTVNAGAIPPTHWTQDATIGGGRIVGEACHFIDLLRHLSGAPIENVDIAMMQAATQDTATLTLRFADGSLGTIHYFSNGHKGFPKERLEVFAQGRILRLDNFRRLEARGWPGFKTLRLWRQDKGQRAMVAAFLAAMRGERAALIPPGELFEVTRATLVAAR